MTNFTESEQPRIRAIPTRYKNIEFRSKLEANVAACLDACGVEWSYEQEGYELGAPYGRYLPDLWLPQAKQFVEVKGRADDPSLEKSVRLAYLVRCGPGAVPDEEEAARPASVVILVDPFVRHEWRGSTRNEVFGFGFNGVEDVDALLVRCRACGVPFFMTAAQGWTCSACGKWSSEHERVLVHVDHVRGGTRYELAR